MLRQFEAAQRIRQMYFRQGSQDPQLQFTITPSDLDAGALRFTLEIDGQTVDYRHAAPRPSRSAGQDPSRTWSFATFEERSGGRPNIVFRGPVGLASHARTRAGATRIRGPLHDDRLRPADTRRN
jgi:type VI secretion system protein ImpL